MAQGFADRHHCVHSFAAANIPINWTTPPGLQRHDRRQITSTNPSARQLRPPDPAGFVPTTTQAHASPPLAGLPPFCRVSIVVAPAINIEVWLPNPGAWNDRFRGVGGGGYAGTISWGALAGAVLAGYATAS